MQRRDSLHFFILVFIKVIQRYCLVYLQFSLSGHHNISYFLPLNPILHFTLYLILLLHPSIHHSCFLPPNFHPQSRLPLLQCDRGIKPHFTPVKCQYADLHAIPVLLRRLQRLQGVVLGYHIRCGLFKEPVFICHHVVGGVAG